jgi:regulator of replication initiation timing
MGTENLDVAVARLDERVEQMANDIKRMANAYEELVRSNQRIGLLEHDLANVKDAQKKLAEKFDAHEAAQKKITGLVLYDVVKLIIAIAVGVALERYGVRLP